MSAKGKWIYPNLRRPPKNKMCVKKKYFTLNFVHLVHTDCHILSTFSNQCRCMQRHSQCLHLPHTLLTFPPSPLPFHYISSSVSSTALDIQHLLKHFTVTSGEMCCHAVTILIDQINNTFIFLGLWTYFNPWRYTIFYTDGVSGVKNFKYMSFGFLGCVCGLISLS